MEMARAAAEAVRAVPLEERGRTVGMGADGTPTKFIDKVAEDVILRYIEDEGIEANFLSEEAGYIDRGCELTLVTDPLDGTHNAASGIPYYAVSIALGKDDILDLEEGVVINIVTGDEFYGARGKGAYLNDERIRVREYDEGRDLLLAYMGVHAAPETYDVVSRFRRVRSLGAAALEICAVACGQADGFYLNFRPEKRSLRVVDIAAGVLMVREAGGEVYDIVGNVLGMRLSLDVRTNMMAVGSNQMFRKIKE